jgi:hypothetical protein
VQDELSVTKGVTIRLVEIADLLGVSKQSAHQIAGDSSSPAPVAEDHRGRMWDRREVTAQAKTCRAAKPWR